MREIVKKNSESQQHNISWGRTYNFPMKLDSAKRYSAVFPIINIVISAESAERTQKTVAKETPTAIEASLSALILPLTLPSSLPNYPDTHTHIKIVATRHGFYPLLRDKRRRVNGAHSTVIVSIAVYVLPTGVLGSFQLLIAHKSSSRRTWTKSSHCMEGVDTHRNCGKQKK